jgi:hypothetical protein
MKFKSMILAAIATFGISVALATVTSTDISVTYNTAGTSSLSITFPFLDNDHVQVWLVDTTTDPDTETLLVYGAGAGKYTITGGDPGDTVVLGTAIAAGEKIIIKRSTEFTQATDYIENGPFLAESHETALDKLTYLSQELDDKVSRKIGLSSVSSATAPTFPDPSANAFVLYNSAGDNLTLSSSPSSGDVLKFGTSWEPYDLDTAITGLQSQIDTKAASSTVTAHTSDTDNPHEVTAAQVGNDTAQWNASQIQGTDVDASAIDDGRVLSYDGASGDIVWAPAPLAPALTDSNIFVGNASNTAAGVAVSGDATMANTGALTIATVGGSTAANIATGEALANAATDANTASAIVRRDASGDFAAGTITADLTGDVTGNASTATALAANPDACSAGEYVTDVAADGTLTCGEVDSLPTQTGNSGKYLTTDGTDASWGSMTGGNFTNYAVNGHGGDGTTGWTASAGTLAAGGTAPNTYISWTPAAGADTLTNAGVAVADGGPVDSLNGALYCRYKTASAAHVLSIRHDGTAVQSYTLPASSAEFATVTLYQSFSSTAVTDDFVITAGDTDQIDIRCFFGDARAVGFGDAAHISNCTSYTPTFSAGWGDVTGVDFEYCRVGPNAVIRGYFVAGTTSGVAAWVSLPTGLTADSANPKNVGSFTTSHSSTAGVVNSAVAMVALDANLGRVYATNIGNGSTTNNMQSIYVDSLWGNVCARIS